MRYNKHNLGWSCPTQGIDTRLARRWLQELALGELDRLELDQCLRDWELCERQIGECQHLIAERVARNPTAGVVRTMPGASDYAALALASRIGDVQRFATPRSLGNYWGLVPSCRDSGEKTGRLGSITKDGSPVARFILGQIVLHVLKKDGKMRAWYKEIRQRRGSKIARVAVMRRLTTILWHMLRNQTPYVIGGPPPCDHRRRRNPRSPDGLPEISAGDLPRRSGRLSPQRNPTRFATAAQTPQ